MLISRFQHLSGISDKRMCRIMNAGVFFSKEVTIVLCTYLFQVCIHTYSQNERTLRIIRLVLVHLSPLKDK